MKGHSRDPSIIFMIWVFFHTRWEADVSLTQPSSFFSSLVKCQHGLASQCVHPSSLLSFTLSRPRTPTRFFSSFPPPLSHYLCLSWSPSFSASSPFPRVNWRNTSTMGRLAVPGPWSHDSSTPLSVRCIKAWHVGRAVNSVDSVQQLPYFLMEKEGEKKQFYYSVLVL